MANLNWGFGPGNKRYRRLAFTAFHQIILPLIVGLGFIELMDRYFWTEASPPANSYIAYHRFSGDDANSAIGVTIMKFRDPAGGCVRIRIETEPTDRVTECSDSG